MQEWGDKNRGASGGWRGCSFRGPKGTLPIRTSFRLMPHHEATNAPFLAIEEDMHASAGRLFVDLIAEYFAATAEGSGHVSTPRSAEELFTRFDEPLPAEGRPLEEVVRRLS